MVSVSTPVATRQVALVVEDEHDLRETVAGLLAEEGYAVLVAADGAEALRLTQQQRPNVILLDMRLPVMDGWEFAHRYRSGPPPHAPIVVMTAAVDAQQRAREVGASATLPKPFLINDLLACVAALTAPPQAIPRTAPPPLQQETRVVPLVETAAGAATRGALQEIVDRLEALLGYRAGLVGRLQSLRERRVLIVRELSTPPAPSAPERAARLASLAALGNEESVLLDELAALARDHQRLLVELDQAVQDDL